METSSDAVEAAIARVAEILRSPDDLVKTSLLRKRLAIEKANNDAQLKNGVKAQLDTTQEGIDMLTSSKEKMNTIKDNMQTIDRLCSEAQNMIQHFPRINKISQIHRNFIATQDTVQRLQEMHLTIDQMQNMLEIEKLNILGPAKNLLFIHYQLFRLQEFRDITMYQANTSSQDDDFLTLKQYFKRLDVVSEDFLDYLWTLSKNIMNLARNEQGSVIVRIVKVIEAEERADEKAKTAEHARHSHQDLATKFKSVQTSPRVIRSFRSRFQDKLHDSISELFEEFYDKYKDTPTELLDQLDFIFDDLALVFQEIVPRFPKKYNIFSVYVLAYHRHVYNILDRIVNNDPDAGTILRLIRWVRSYYKRMNKEIRISEDILEPPLLDGREQDLINDYLKLVRELVDTWMSNLMNGETNDFVERSKAPEEDGDLYYLSGSVYMFQIVNQQIDVAVESGQGKILADVVKECCEVMLETQQTWMNLLKSELKKQIDKPDEVPPGFVDYVIALANDQIRCADFTDEVLNRLAPLLSEKYRNQINNDLEETMKGFLSVARAAKDTLLDVVFNDLKKPFSQFFTSEWYQEDSMLLIIETIKDYTFDFCTHLNEYLKDKIMTNTLDRFIIAYIESMRNKGAKFRKPDCINRMAKDKGIAYAFFQQHIPPQELNSRFDSLTRIHTLVESPRKSIYLDYYNLKKAYGDVPIGLIEDILSKRDDLDRSQIKEIMVKAKAKAKDTGEYTGTPTIFSKLSL
ncbi:15915_t:CDS:2 [Funneliformis caledonium]|uniref:15915_t:CDS:1 n=1 Tax=Funneliformis caledonium TaxID=1117310 RepID=A0A9N8ZCB2_9GLOM|nr:15915_t:CDS:2 [Funneliformis caledonium]